MPSDIEIAQGAALLPIWDIAERAGIRRSEIELYGDFKAKVKPEILARLPREPAAKYIDVTAITPTPLGEGKTVNTIGLSLGLAKLGHRVFTTIRQPSLGPVFGIKGGAAGGGMSQVVPMEDFNLHLTGDVHAVGAANNLLAAWLDALLLHGNPHGMDARSIAIRRVLDMNDRSLRHVVVGLGGSDDGVPRETSFDITVASEVMAILALASDLQDMRRRLGRMVVAYTKDGKPVTAEDVKAAGAMAVLLRDAIKPNLLQTLEHTPCFVHAGPFANIAHGNSSVVADQIAVRLADYVVTESGFGSDMGMEKFMNIKCRATGLVPDAVAVVVSIRALKVHSGKFKIVAGKPLDPGLAREDCHAVELGCANLEKHLENVRAFGLPAVVAVNRFGADTDAEIAVVRRRAEAAGAFASVVSEVWAKGGEGGRAFAEAIAAAAARKSEFRFLYDLDWPLAAKIETIASRMYGAKGVSFSPATREKLERFEALGWGNLPVCMAKTHLSLSHDAALQGRPRDFVVPVRDIRASIGAGFVYPLLGEMRTMPGLPSRPSLLGIDIDAQGRVVGLS